MTKPVHWRTQVCDFNTNSISKVENELPELKAPRIVTWISMWIICMESIGTVLNLDVKYFPN